MFITSGNGRGKHNSLSRRRRRRRRRSLHFIKIRRREEEEEEEVFIPAVTGEASTTRCRVAPAQTNPRLREGDPRRLGLPHYDERYMLPCSVASTPWSLVKASSFVVCVPPLPRLIAEGRWVTWLGR